MSWWIVLFVSNLSFSAICQWSAEMNYTDSKEKLGLGSKSFDHESMPNDQKIRLHRGENFECYLAPQKAMLGNTRFVRDYNCKIGDTISRLEVSCELQKSAYITQVKNEFTHRLFNKKGERVFWIRMFCQCMDAVSETKKKSE